MSVRWNGSSPERPRSLDLKAAGEQNPAAKPAQFAAKPGRAASVERDSDANLPADTAKSAANVAEKPAAQGDEPTGAVNLAEEAAKVRGCLSVVSGFAATRPGSHTEIHPFEAPEALPAPVEGGWTMLLVMEDANWRNKDAKNGR